MKIPQCLTFVIHNHLFNSESNTYPFTDNQVPVIDSNKTNNKETHSSVFNVNCPKKGVKKVSNSQAQPL